MSGERVCACSRCWRPRLNPQHAEPLTCTCTEPRADGVGECRTCRRLVAADSGGGSRG